MAEISSVGAAESHGISTKHEQMPNGELRFRLSSSSDGTKYIRTAAGGTGAWQDSHFHRSVRETYIVQHGWMAYAELDAGGVSLTVYREGDLFTTSTLTPHNVYLPASAVIHTVKHGHSTLGDWESSPELDTRTKHLSESDILSLSSRRSGGGVDESASPYNAAYRHFDILIWQGPAWATAVFVGAVIGVGTAQGAGGPLVTSGGPVTPHLFLGAFLGVVFLAIFALGHVIYRFRVHQAPFRRHRTSRLASAQAYLQTLVTLESAVVLLGLFALARCPALYSFGVPVALLVGLTLYRETKVTKATRGAGT